MSWFVTLLAALTVIAGFTTQNVTIVYWTNSPISFYGILLLCGCSFAIIFGIALFFYALIYQDFSALYVSDDPIERKFFGNPFRKNGTFRLTQAQVVCLVGFLNSLNGWLIVYASPSDRTPPLIQAVLQNAGVLFSVPFSKIFLQDRKPYCSILPGFAAILILSSVVVSLLPSLISSNNGTSGLNSATAIAWCLIYFAGLAPGAGYNVCQQLYFLRADMLSPDISPRTQARGTLRALFYGNLAQAISYLLFFWIDLLPWFGETSSLDTFRQDTAFSLACSVGGPSLSSYLSNKECQNSTQLWAWVFILGYAISYVGASVLNRESATFNMLVLVVVTMTTAAFWLIPGTNPNPSNTPLWSVLTSLGLSIVGTIIWKYWENGTMPPEEQFGVEPDNRIDHNNPSRKNTGRSFHGDNESYSYSALAYDDINNSDYHLDNELHNEYTTYRQNNSSINNYENPHQQQHRFGGISDAVRSLVAKHQSKVGNNNNVGSMPKYARMNL